MININKKYKSLLEFTNRYFLITGGRGSGKSFTTSLVLLLLTFEKGHTILFTRYTLRAAGISIIPEFIEKIEMMGFEDTFKITKDEIINLDTGSKILFRGLKTSSGDQTANLKSLAGVTTWVLDEAEELTDEAIFDKIDLSIRHKSLQNRVILIMNPTTKEHFIYKRFFEATGVQEGSNVIKNECAYIHTTYHDNINNLSESFLNRMNEMKLHRPEKYNHQILGGWLNKAEGIIFDNWSVGEFFETDSTCFGIDFGFSNDPTASAKISIDKKNKKIFLKEILYEKALTTSDIANVLKHYNGLFIGDNAEPRLIYELKQHKINIVPCTKYKIIEGIALLQDYDLVIDPTSTNLIKELNNYSWLEKKSQTPIDNFNHLLDCIRYGVTYLLGNVNKGVYDVY